MKGESDGLTNFATRAVGALVKMKLGARVGGQGVCAL